jgi:hypothetical protein
LFYHLSYIIYHYGSIMGMWWLNFGNVGWLNYEDVGWLNYVDVVGQLWDVVAQLWGCSGSHMRMLWLKYEDVVARLWGCGGSIMRILWFTYGDVVVQLWGSTMGMWSLNFGDVVA